MKISDKIFKSNLPLAFVFLIIISFLIFVAFRNEKRNYTPAPEDTIKIKQPVEVKSPIINNEEGKG